MWYFSFEMFLILYLRDWHNFWPHGVGLFYICILIHLLFMLVRLILDLSSSKLLWKKNCCWKTIVLISHGTRIMALLHILQRSSTPQYFECNRVDSFKVRVCNNKYLLLLCKVIKHIYKFGVIILESAVENSCSTLLCCVI